MRLGTNLRDARLQAGLSQAELAARSGVSRQTVGAIESGRHRPGVDAAIALAGVVGTTVEALFAAAPITRSLEVLPGPTPGGPGSHTGAVLAARVGDQLVHAAASQALAFQGWPQANARLEDGVPRALPGADLDGFVVVGCDPALGLAAAQLPAAGQQHVIAVAGSTMAAIDALTAGRAHGALVHGRSGRLPKAPAGTLRLHLARWQVGLATGATRTSLDELLERGGEVVQREAGASSQQAFLTALRQHGAAPDRPGPVERGHLEVARRVAAGAAAGVTMEPAALALGLGFHTLEEHTVELWIDARWHDHPATEALGRVLRSAAFTSRLSLVGGYDLAGCGDRQTGAAAA